MVPWTGSREDSKSPAGRRGTGRNVTATFGSGALIGCAVCGGSDEEDEGEEETGEH